MNAKPTKSRRNVHPDQLTIHSDFNFRDHATCPAHKADLVCALRNSRQAFDPIVVWETETETGKTELILLDGQYRLAAYQVANWQGEIPVIVWTGIDRRRALSEALRANSKRTLGLTQEERLNAAWRLVREAVSPRYKIREISAAADVSGRTVDHMRARFKAMRERKEIITGFWRRDMRPQGPDTANGLEMTEAQRTEGIIDLCKALRDAFDRRKHPDKPILREEQAIWEAIGMALGEPQLKAMVEHLLCEEENEWLEAAGTKTTIDWLQREPFDGTDEGEEDHDHEPNF